MVKIIQIIKVMFVVSILLLTNIPIKYDKQIEQYKYNSLNLSYIKEYISITLEVLKYDRYRENQREICRFY